MPFLKPGNPYLPGYAIPKAWTQERDKNVHTIAGVPRGTVDPPPPQYPKGFLWNPGYAIPDEWYHEPWGGVQVTPWAPHGMRDKVDPIFYQATGVFEPAKCPLVWIAAAAGLYFLLKKK